MDILYGVTGEGIGHATRSHVILEHLRKKHDVHIVASNKAYNYLSRLYDDITEIEGFELTIDDNELDRSKTFTSILKSMPKKTRINFNQFMDTRKKISPDVVISDFDSFAYMFGRTHRRPVIAIDNIHVISRCDIEIPVSMWTNYKFTKTIIGNKLPNCKHYLLTTFFYPEVMEKNTHLFGPIVRPKVYNAKKKEGEHILVYQTSNTSKRLMKLLNGLDRKFIIYGYNEDKKVGQLEFKNFSEQGFIDDLASAKGVIANSGFSLISEALTLQKPYYAIPLKKQFEQMLNGLYLKRLGYGEFHDLITKKHLTSFTENLDKYHDNLKNFKHDKNKKILGKLDRILKTIPDV